MPPAASSPTAVPVKETKPASTTAASSQQSKRKGPAKGTRSQSGTAHAAKADRSSRQAPDAAEPRSDSLAGQLRFSLEGEAVEIKMAVTEAANPTEQQQIVQRDILRC